MVYCLPTTILLHLLLAAHLRPRPTAWYHTPPFSDVQQIQTFPPPAHKASHTRPPACRHCFICLLCSAPPSFAGFVRCCFATGFVCLLTPRLRFGSPAHTSLARSPSPARLYRRSPARLLGLHRLPVVDKKKYKITSNDKKTAAYRHNRLPMMFRIP